MRATAGIQAVQLLGLGIPVDDEQVAADSAAHRLDQPEHRIDRDRRIDGVAAGQQDLSGIGRSDAHCHGLAAMVLPAVDDRQPIREAGQPADFRAERADHRAGGLQGGKLRRLDAGQGA